MDLEKIINENVDFYLIEKEFPKICDELGLDYDEAYNELNEATVKGAAKVGGAAGLLGTMGLGSLMTGTGALTGWSVGSIAIGGITVSGAAAGAILGIIPGVLIGAILALLGAGGMKIIKKLESDYKKDIDKCKMSDNDIDKKICSTKVELKRAEGQLKLLTKALKECSEKSTKAKKCEDRLKGQIKVGEDTVANYKKELTKQEKAKKLFK